MELDGQDIVQANTIALNPQCSGLFNVGTGKETSVNFLTRCLIKASAIATSIEHGPAKKGEQKRSSIDSGKLLKGFGWKPIVSVEEGLLETFNYFKNKKT
jgi:UDP-glucose 4-epimerase